MHYMKKLLPIILLMLTCIAHAQDTSTQKRITLLAPAIDEMIKTYATNNNFPGIAYGIVADGKLIYLSLIHI